MSFTAYVLARNEEANLPRSLGALRAAKVRSVCVLDSGSSDRMRDICAQYQANVESYRYTTHLDAYRYICMERTPEGHSVLILDADMLVSPELVAEALACVERGAEVVEAPIRMYWNGLPMRRGSLCPPKPFLFLGGKQYFTATGHGEKLLPAVKLARTQNYLGHDDRKPFDEFLRSQVRYSSSLIRRASQGQLTFRDRIRLRSGILVAAVPLLSYVFKGGWLSGRAGLGYALDRLIAEAVMYRQALANSGAQKLQSGDSGQHTTTN
jgi:glycosyltransferase involved in cell wall biosynthesis